MMARLAWLLPWLAMTGLAWAGYPSQCLVAQHQIEHIFPLPHAARAIAAGKLPILVVGTGSSTLPGPNGARNAYPARLRQALVEALPGFVVTVETDVKSRRTAAEMVKTLPASLAATKPALVVWQTGTVDAMQAADPDRFSDALMRGIDLARSAGADVILVNAQYSPRTESMIALGTYSENMRWVALQQQVPEFNRFAVMKLWADLGTFDFTDAPRKLEVAERVHGCIGRLLADQVIEATKPAGPQGEGSR
jgi:hypothetical protein